MSSHVEITADAQALAQAAAGRFVALAKERIDAHAEFRVALAGGSTPRPTYRLLASPPYSDRVIWSKVQIYWGDERSVPPDHPESNYRMAHESLLQHISLPPEHIHRIQGELDPAQAAEIYAEELASTFFEGSSLRREASAQPPRFDLIILGMGEDGHMASIFPGMEAMEETQRWVVPTHPEEQGVWRVTLTLPVLNAARNVVMLVSGAAKAATLRRVLLEAPPGEALPAQRLSPDQGRLLWLVDRAAASMI